MAVDTSQLHLVAIQQPHRVAAMAHPPRAAALAYLPRAAAMPHHPRVAAMPHHPRAAAMPHHPRAAVMPHQPRAAAMPHLPRAAVMLRQPRVDTRLREVMLRHRPAMDLVTVLAMDLATARPPMVRHRQDTKLPHEAQNPAQAGFFRLQASSVYAQNHESMIRKIFYRFHSRHAQADILKELSALMENYIACHAAYRFDVTSRVGSRLIPDAGNKPY